jgi:hypothetical protein
MHASSEASILESGPRSLATSFPVPYQRFEPPSSLVDSCQNQTTPPLPGRHLTGKPCLPTSSPVLLIHDSSLKICLELDTVLARASLTKPSTFPSVDRPVSSFHDSWSLSVNLRPLTHYISVPTLHLALAST